MKTTKYSLLIACLAIIVGVGCKKDKAPPTLPTVTTAALTNITSSNATAGGTITNNGGENITASGVVLSRINTTPTLSDTVLSGTATSGSFTANLTNLDFNTTYYIRAYATNSVGTGYGSVVTLNTTNDTSKVRFNYNGSSVVYGIITSSATGKKWMDRNLGASQVATSPTDALAFGDLFEWGRPSDQHQLRTSDTIGILSSTDVPGHNKFIKSIVSPNNDWRNPQNPNLWQSSSGINNPCPTGWHVPTQDEWTAEKDGSNITNYTIAYNILRITAGGYRFLDGSLSGIGSFGYYWTSTPESGGTLSGAARFGATSASTASIADRGTARAIRCIKD